ncbi:amidohydrolase family protein [Streptomyces sp. NPDC055078]
MGDNTAAAPAQPPTIIDFRGRPPTEEFLSYFVRQKTIVANLRLGVRAPAPSFLKRDVDLFFAEMDEAGIGLTVALGRNSPVAPWTRPDTPPEERQNGVLPNDHIADLVAAHPGRLVGIAGIDVSNELHDSLAETRRCIEEFGFKGIHIEPARTRYEALYNDRRIYPLYELCQEMSVPVVLMTGPMYGRNIRFDHPADIQDVARDFPDLPLVAGHGCYPWVTQIISVALKHPNVYLCPDVYMFVPGAEQYVQAANTFLQDQLLFGTAYPYAPLGESVGRFRSLGLTEESMRKALYDNAARLLALETVPLR